MLLLLCFLVLCSAQSDNSIFFDFEDELSPYNSWRLVGDVDIIPRSDDDSNNCLRLGQYALATFDVNVDDDGNGNNAYGNLTFYTMETDISSSATGINGPRFGIANSGEDLLEFGIFRRSWLTNSKYTFVDTVTYTNLYSPYSVSSSAATRSTAWRRWDFVSTPEATHVYIDGSHVYTSQEFNMGLSQIRFEGDWAFVETFCFDNVSFIKTDDGVDLPYPFPGPFSVSSLLANQSFFPFAVWDQPSYLAEFYKNISINLFIANGLSGETDETFLDNLNEYGIMGIVAPGDDDTLDSDKVTSLMNHPALFGWMFSDEPDIMHYDSSGNAVDGPDPADVYSLRDQVLGVDPYHSLFTNLGSGTSQRTLRYRPYSDYWKYTNATDIVCYDIYPVASYKNGSSILYAEAEGIVSLRRFSRGKKFIFTWLECSTINGVNRAPTPWEVKAEVWMAIIHGANGIGWFPQVWTPSFYFQGIPTDVYEEMGNIGKMLTTKMAPIINSAEKPKVDVTLEAQEQGFVEFTTRWYNSRLYIFAVNMQNHSTSTKFKLSSSLSFTVIDEDRSISSTSKFTEDFISYQVHLYESGTYSGGGNKAAKIAVPIIVFLVILPAAVVGSWIVFRKVKQKPLLPQREDVDFVKNFVSNKVDTVKGKLHS